MPIRAVGSSPNLPPQQSVRRLNEEQRGTARQVAVDTAETRTQRKQVQTYATSTQNAQQNANTGTSTSSQPNPAQAAGNTLRVQRRVDAADALQNGPPSAEAAQANAQTRQANANKAAVTTFQANQANNLVNTFRTSTENAQAAQNNDEDGGSSGGIDLTV